MAFTVTSGSNGSVCCGAGRLSGPSGLEAMARPLAVALYDARTAAARLAVRFLAYAQASGEPAAVARAAAVTAAANALGRARLLIGGSHPVPSGTAGEQAARPSPAEETGEIAQLLAGARLLTQAVSALYDRMAQLASSAAEPLLGSLTGAQTCLRVAGQQLAQAFEPAVGRPSGHGQPSAEDLPHQAGAQ